MELCKLLKMIWDDLFICFKHQVRPYSITSAQNVSIQVQPFCYQSQPGHNPQLFHMATIPRTINATTTGRDLGSYPTKLLIQVLNATQRHKHSYQTNYLSSALNATQGHKPAIKQAIYRSQMMGMIQCSKWHTGTQA